MATVPAGLVIDLNSNLDGTTAAGFRRALAVLFKQSAPGVALSGRLGEDHLVVSGHPTLMQYTVSAGGCVITRSAAGGAYLVGFPENQTLTTSASNGVNPRWDRIFVRQPDPALDGAGVNVNFVIDRVVGTPGPSPALPALPAGAFELARKFIAADATNTASGAAFSDIAPTTGLNFGGTLALNQGGTGATTKAGARANLGFTYGTANPNNAVGDDGDIYFKIV